MTTLQLPHSSVAFHAVAAVCVVTVWMLCFRTARKRLSSHVGGVFALALVTGVSGPFTADNVFELVRLAACSLFLYLPALLLGCAMMVCRRAKLLATVEAAVALLLLGIAADAFLIEPYRLQFEHVVITSDNVTEPIRIALVADIQTDAPGEYELRALQQTMDFEPDILLFAGDYLQCDSEEAAVSARQQLNRIMRTANVRGRLGAFAVSGNIDRFSPWEEVFADTAVEIITHDRTMQVGELTLTCLSFPSSLRKRVSIPQADGFHVVVGHVPNFAIDSTGGDLLLAGHTHGGQVRLPLIGPPLTLCAVPRAWSSGQTQLENGRQLIVANGVGMERRGAPKIRFLCPPQIYIIDIVGP